jgi:hypothetical protein
MTNQIDKQPFGVKNLPFAKVGRDGIKAQILYLPKFATFFNRAGSPANLGIHIAYLLT